jgi:mRNA export factor
MFGVKSTNTNSSFEVPSGPSDTISSIAWSPVSNILACGSWDKSVRIYEVQSNMNAIISATPRAMYSHEGSVLCLTFTKDGMNLLSGGTDNKIKMYNLPSQKDQIIGQHDAPVKDIAWIEEMRMCVTTSWDRTMKFWSLPNTPVGGMGVGGAAPAAPVATMQLPERAYAMDCKYPLLVVGCADRKIVIYNLTQISQNPNPWRVMESKLKMQTRCISCFNDKSGFALGSIEGRCMIYTFDQPENKELSFEYKCHRTVDEIYPMNCVDFHPSGVFVSAGGDGILIIWDRLNKSRNKSFNSCNYPITATKFSSQGDIIAYAVGYDWSKGHEHYNANIPVKLFLHKLQEIDVKQKPAGSNNTAATGGSSAFNRRR